MQFRIRHLEDETVGGGELLRPFGPGQIALKFSHVVGALNVPLSEEELEFRPRHAGVFGRSAERQQTACIQSHRHLLRHFRLRRRRRQVDFLQKAIGNIKCQRHSDKVAASTENGKLSTGPRLRENDRVRSSSLSYFAHIIQKLLNQPVRVENFGVLESLDKWFHFANRTGVLASGKNSKGTNGDEIHANRHFARWQIVEQNGKALFSCKGNCFRFARAQALAQSYQMWAFLHSDNSNPICSNWLPDTGLRCDRCHRCIHFEINGLRNDNGAKYALDQVESFDCGKRDQRR
jgi:hypothetical protein